MGNADLSIKCHDCPASIAIKIESCQICVDVVQIASLSRRAAHGGRSRPGFLKGGQGGQDDSMSWLNLGEVGCK